MKDENDDFQLLGVLLHERQTDICDCRVAFANENCPTTCFVTYQGQMQMDKKLSGVTFMTINNHSMNISLYPQSF